ncbi:MAG: AAA family ATPase [Desulfobacterales bacterium]|nr:AAA family ATPase [Desulfobacterales bacterium]
MVTIPYSEKLKDPRWQKKRLEIFQRDNWTCQEPDCGDTATTLVVHHKQYIPDVEPWEYEDEDLVTLCVNCHEDKHSPYITAQYHIDIGIEKTLDTLEERQGSKALITGVPTGFYELDNITAGLQNSELTVIAGRPSMGKTSLILGIARNVVKTEIPVIIFSLEMAKYQLSMRLLCSEAMLDSFRLRGGFLSKEDWERITDAAGRLTESPFYIDDSPAISLDKIRTVSRRFKRDKGLGLIIIDYLQLMKIPGFKERRELEVAEIVRSLKTLAKELDIPIVIASQLNRKLEERSDKRPQLADLRETGSIEDDSDVVIFVYRDEVYNRDENNPNRGKAELIVAKNRNGPVGTASLAFINRYTRFDNLADEPEN